MVMTLRLSDEQTEALRRRATEEGRSVHEVVRTALDEYLLGPDDDVLTSRVADQGRPPLRRAPAPPRRVTRRDPRVVSER
jgi:plasmid stability protein